MTENAQLITWSIVAEVVGGVILLLSSLIMIVAAPMMGMMGGMMGMSSTGGMTWMMLAFASVGILTGSIALLAAYRTRKEPEEARPWGVAALVAGVVSLLSMGGFLIGAAASIVGGILAILATSVKASKAGPIP